LVDVPIGNRVSAEVELEGSTYPRWVPSPIRTSCWDRASQEPAPRWRSRKALPRRRCSTRCAATR